MRAQSFIAAFFGLSSLAAAADCPVADVSIIAHSGTPVGREEVHEGVNLYITGNQSDTAVLYLTDIYGINLTENKLLADSFGRAGYLTVAPDMFNGSPSTLDLIDPGFNLTAFLEANTVEDIEALIDVAVRYLKEIAGVAKIAVTGYCFGGRYAFRYASAAKGPLAAAFAAHPSMLEDDEVSAVAAPVAMAAAANDSGMPPERRDNITALLQAAATAPQLAGAFNVALYGGTSHGFGVRANVSDPVQKFGKESAFFQAVRWFETWAV